MRVLLVFLSVVILSAATGQVQAQTASLQNTAWKWYLDALHDTLVMHIGVDSGYTTSSSGDVLVKSAFKINKDTLRIMDVSGQYVCTNQEGVYRVTVDGDYLSFFVIADPCDNRANALAGVKMKKSASK